MTDGWIRTLAVSGNTLYVGGDFDHVGPATGSAVPLDPATGVPLALPGVKGRVFAIAPDGSGGWFLGGDFTHVGGVARANLAHVQSDHSLSDWDPGADSTVYTIATGGGVVYVGGLFTGAGGAARAALAALDATTGAATSWDPAPSAPFTLVISNVAVGGATVYVAGTFDSIGGAARTYLAALDASTGAATGWIPQPDQQVASLAAGGGVVYAGGYFTTIGGASRNRIAALDGVTGTATGWDPNPAFATTPDTPGVFALAIDGGTVYAAGTFSTIGGATRAGVAALDATTAVATSWDADLGPIGAGVYLMALDEGTLFMKGTFGTVGGAARAGLAAVDASDGSVTAWAPHPDLTVSVVSAAGGTVWIGGAFTTVDAVTRHNVAAIDLATGMLTPWDPDVTGLFIDAVHDIEVSGGIVYLAGYFTTVGAEFRNMIAAVDSATGLATAWDAQAYAPQATYLHPFVGGINDIEVHGETVYAAGYFTMIGGAARRSIAALDATTAAATAWNPDPATTLAQDPVVERVVAGDGVIYATGNFDQIGGAPRLRIAALDPVTGTATAWDPGADGSVLALVRVDDLLYVGGSFTTIGGASRSHLAALDVATGAATAWDAGADDVVRVLALEGATLLAGGDFTTVCGADHLSVVALDAAPGAPLAWSPAFGASSGDPPVPPAVYDLALHGGALYMGGYFGSFGNLPIANLACVNDANLLAVGAPPAGPVTGVAIVALSPNPSSGGIAVEYVLPRSARARIEVLDATGRRVARPVNEDQSSGRHRFVWSGRGDEGRLRPGIYWMRLSADAAGVARRFVLIR